MAASRIKGITVEIGGDTTKLQTALKGVNSEIKNTQSQLKDVNKLLKLDPGNTELLAQKHKLLGDAVGETKEKLETLKTAAEQANTALANGDISQEQYDALQREIVETENELKNLETQANQSATALQKISATGEKLQTVGGQISSVGQSLLPVSAAVTGLGVAGLKVASDFETGMSEVKAITGATGEDFERLSDTAIDLGASTAFSSQEVAAGMTEMAKAGWTTEQIIDGMSGVLSAAAASGSELGTVSTIVADAITGFGLAASDSTRVADLLTQAANTGTIDIEDLGESFKYVAPLCSAMGFSIEDATTALAAMSTAEIKGSQAGTSLRTAFLNMASPTDAVASAMDKIGLTVTDANGNFKSMDTILAEMRTGMDGMTQAENGLNYESKAQLREEFKDFQSMFLLVGLTLCFIVGLIGILNFFNAILTGILTRRREFAMLQSVGMTGVQLKQMLTLEGVFYALGAGILAILLTLALNPLLGRLLETLFWFFSYCFVLWPVLAMLPVFLLLGILLPLAVYHFTAKKSIVERLREAEV